MNSFTRAEFYGLNFNWYASDSEGCVAEFTTGYGPMPRELFTDEKAYDAVDRFFQASSPSCSSILSPWARYQHSLGIGDYSRLLAEAQRGFFIFQEEDYGPEHRLYTIPSAPLSLTALPEFVKRFILQFSIPALKFSIADTINVEEHFDCIA